MRPRSPQLVDVGLCYRPSAGGTLTNFNGNHYVTQEARAERRDYGASGSVVPGAGSCAVGLCVRNSGGTLTLGNNDWVNGWVQVTN